MIILDSRLQHVHGNNAFSLANSMRLVNGHHPMGKLEIDDRHSPASPDNSVTSSPEDDEGEEEGEAVGEESKKYSKSQRNRTAYTSEQVDALEKGTITIRNVFLAYSRKTNSERTNMWKNESRQRSILADFQMLGSTVPKKLDNHRSFFKMKTEFLAC